MIDKAVQAVSSPVFTVLSVLELVPGFTLSPLVVVSPLASSLESVPGVTTAEAVLACCPNHSHALISPS